ncbi:MAG TPA: TonB-dependent receptor [Pyrinomonadaceae bacterium]|nr:TonB-dependent receptor [Pyrinomonadaceae bacterium]
MFKRMAQALFCLAMIIGVTGVCFAQATGGIKGTVSDAAGALVAGAAVEVLNNNTGDKRTTTSADNGSFSITNLPVGTYTVTASATGFSPATAQDVQVSVAFVTDVTLALAVGGTTANVTVTAGDIQTQLNNTDQQLSTLIDNKKIMDLPLLSRDPNGLILLAPGVTQTQTSLGGFSVNGQRERNNNFLVDGIDNNDADVPGIAGGAATPNIDATQEFRVLTSNFNAEYGRNTGAVINVATKNGTNQFHGGGYMYYRSGRFAARNFFDDEKAPLQRKQFGGSIGGPIVKDKAFFFFNYEGDRSLSSTTETRTVPSAQARLGIFPNTPFGTLDVGLNGANNRSALGICDVFGAPGLCPLILPNGNLGINPGMQKILNLYPLGNVSGQGTLPGVFDLFRFTAPNRSEVDTTASRIDWHVSENHTLTGSFNTSNGDFDLFPETFPGTGDNSRTPQKSYLLSLNLTSNLTPSLINELRFGGNRIEAIFNGPGDGGSSRAVFDQILSDFAAGGIDNQLQPFGGPNGELVNLSGGTITPFAAFDTQFRYSGTTVLGDTLTWVKNNHTLRGGFEYRWIYSNGASNFGRSESINFNTAQFGGSFLQDADGNPIPTSGIGGQLQNFASLLYGFFGVQSQSQFFNKDQVRVDEDYRGYRVRESGIFVQDTWRIRPNLTLNYGLRWDYNGVPYEVNGQLSTLVNQDPSGPQPDGGFEFQIVGKNSPNPRLNLWDSDLNNFAPRFGFAYSPDWSTGWISKLTGGPSKMSIRGGYGVFYDRVFTNLFSNSSANPPFQRDFQFLFDFLGENGFTGGIADEGGNIPRVPTQVTSPFAFNGDELVPVIFALRGNNAFQSKFATPYTQSWNFGIQRELGNQFLFEADYVGSHGLNQLRNISGALPSVQRRNAICGTSTDGPCGDELGGDPAPAQINPTGTRSNFLNGVLNTAFNPIFLNLALGQSTFNSMQLRLTKTLTNKRFGTGQIQGSYTWSHSMDDSADGLVPGAGPNGASERGLPRDSSGFAGGFSAGERGNSGFDVRHRMVLNFIYDLPFTFENKTLNRVFAGWTASGIVQSQTGTPYSIFGATDSAGTGLGQRADFAPDGQGLSDLSTAVTSDSTYTGPARSLFRNPCPLNTVNTSPSTCSDPVGPAVGRLGTVGRNQFYGPGFNKVDFSMIKRIPVTENVHFTLRADFFNIFNHTNFGLPGNDINSGLFGQSITAGAPRILQFAGRIDF